MHYLLSIIDRNLSCIPTTIRWGCRWWSWGCIPLTSTIIWRRCIPWPPPLFGGVVFLDFLRYSACCISLVSSVIRRCCIPLISSVIRLLYFLDFVHLVSFVLLVSLILLVSFVLLAYFALLVSFVLLVS